MTFCTSCGSPRGTAKTRTSVPSSEDRRRVSVLFIDLVGFTPYVENADPELVRELQTRFFATARTVIDRYGGVVEKYIGDAVMAIFGAPVATETDAVRCVRSGLELQRALTRLNPGTKDPPQFRVGVSTGEALVDIAAARNGGQAILAGDVVNTASRLQSIAPPGAVLVCENTRAATRDSIRYDQQHPVLLRGRSTPTQVWLAVAPLGRAHHERELSATPLVNRSHELALLVNALHRALREGTPQLVTVLGHAGIGKSRLVYELYRHANRLFDEPVAWRTGQCPPFGENVTYAALADIVKGQAGILDTDPAETARQRLETTIADLGGGDEVGRLADALSPLVGLAGTELSADESESLWRRFIGLLAGHRPTVLVFEDLHWADESMLRFVELLGASLRDLPLLVLCTARPELMTREPTWAAAIGGSLTITLPPLRDVDVATVYTHLLGQATFSKEMLEPLVELADGNPLYAHEYIRMLVEQGALRGRSLQLLGEGVPMPDSVHAVIANRVDLLDPTDRAVLQAAAVVGMQFWPGALTAAMDAAPETVERALRRLEQRDLIHEQLHSTMAGQSEYRFGHVLVRDVCYQRLPRTERIARHERTADWLDLVSGGRDTDLAEVLAHHRYTAHEIAKTLGLDVSGYSTPARLALHRAARRAYALHALDIATGHITRALRLCDQATPTVERLQMELLATEIAFYVDGDEFLTTGGNERLNALSEQLDAAGDPACAARACTLLGQAAWLRADHNGAVRCLDRAVKLYADLPDTVQKAEAFAELGRLHMLNCEPHAAAEAASMAAQIAERLGLTEIAADSRITVGTAKYQAGELGGMAELSEAVEECRGKRLLALRRGLRNLGFVMIEEGNWPRAESLLAEASPSIQGGHNLSTGYSTESQRGYFAGEWGPLMTAADAVLASPSGEWDLQVRGLRTWIGMLRDPTTPFPTTEVSELLAAGERSGFHRLRWTALAHGALCNAIAGQRKEASELLRELISRWRAVRAIATGEWVPEAAHAASLSGAGIALTIGEMLNEVPRQTPWVTAANRTIAGSLADDPDQACIEHRAAVDMYREIPNGTEGALSLALTIRAGLGARGDSHVSRLVRRSREELESFAEYNEAPGLLDLAYWRLATPE